MTKKRFFSRIADRSILSSIERSNRSSSDRTRRPDFFFCWFSDPHAHKRMYIYNIISSASCWTKTVMIEDERKKRVIVFYRLLRSDRTNTTQALRSFLKKNRADRQANVFNFSYLIRKSEPVYLSLLLKVYTYIPVMNQIHLRTSMP